MSRDRSKAMPSQFTCYRWRKEFGGLKIDKPKRPKELENKNDRLRVSVCEVALV